MDTFNTDRCRELAALIVSSGMWQVPTLIRNRTMMYMDDDEYRSDPNLGYMPLSLRRLWEELAQEFRQRISPATRETIQRLFALQTGLVRVFMDAGVNMLTGADSGATGGWCLPGFGLHREFDLLEQAGLTPLEVLQMTTLNGAQFLGRESSMGSVEVGKDANLVLLDANPIDSVQNLHRVASVVRGGTYLSADDLETMKRRTAERMTSGAGPAPGSTQACC